MERLGHWCIIVPWLQWNGEVQQAPPCPPKGLEEYLHKTHAKRQTNVDIRHYTSHTADILLPVEVSRTYFFTLSFAGLPLPHLVLPLPLPFPLSGGCNCCCCYRCGPAPWAGRSSSASPSRESDLGESEWAWRGQGHRLSWLGQPGQWRQAPRGCDGGG